VTTMLIERPAAPVTLGFFSDLHLDSPDHDREALVSDLDYAVSLKARIFIIGDLFTLILPADKRSSGKHRRSRVDALVDVIVEEGFEVLRPYADYIDMMGEGNHEVSALQHYYTDAVNRLRAKLQDVRSKRLPSIKHGGYTGFILMRFKGENHRSGREVIWYHHGKGGSAPVTRGMIDLSRVIGGNRADVYWIGHKHTNAGDIPRVRELDQAGNVVLKNVITMVTAGYEGACHSEEYERSGYVSDWGEETFYAPQSQGAAFIQYLPRRERSSSVLTLKRIVSRRT
jgi:hypothetical protein